MNLKGNIIVISGPSGTGKSSLIKKLFTDYGDELYFSLSSTTREIRKGEKEGINYHYISKEEFLRGIEEGEFLEWAEVHNNYYGTSLKLVKEALDAGKIVIFDIDVQGYKIVKEKLKNLVTSIFITTPNYLTLEKRLYERGTDNQEIILRRLQNSKIEIQAIENYDYVIINDDFARAYSAFEDIFLSVKHKKNTFDLTSFIQSWSSNKI